MFDDLLSASGEGPTEEQTNDEENVDISNVNPSSVITNDLNLKKKRSKPPPILAVFSSSSEDEDDDDDSDVQYGQVDDQCQDSIADTISMSDSYDTTENFKSLETPTNRSSRKSSLTLHRDTIASRNKSKSSQEEDSDDDFEVFAKKRHKTSPLL